VRATPAAAAFRTLATAAGTLVADAVFFEAAEEGGAQAAVVAAVGGEEAGAAAGADGVEEAALHEGAEEPHELAHAVGGRRVHDEAGLVEVDDDALGPGRALAEEQVLDVQVGVATACVVEAPDGAADGGGRRETPCHVGLGREERRCVDRVLLEEGADCATAERPDAPPREGERRPRHGRARGPERPRHAELLERPAEPEERRAEHGPEEPAVQEAPQVETRHAGPEREQRGRRAAAPVARGERALERVGLEQPRLERGRFERRVDDELAPPAP